MRQARFRDGAGRPAATEGDRGATLQTNRWSASARSVAQQRCLRAAFGPGPVWPVQHVLQRYIDVRTADFVEENTLVFALASAKFLSRYFEVQRFLADIGRTKPLLDELDRQLLAQPRTTLSQLLRLTEGGGPPAKLVEAVPPPAFASLVAEGVRFEDWVGDTHGTQSHRIQWYLIRAEFDGESDELYRESTNPIWRLDENAGTSIWDLVVDSSHHNDEHDFTSAEGLQTYLANVYAPPARRLVQRVKALLFPASNLRSAIATEAAGFQERKQALTARAPEFLQEEAPTGDVAGEGGRWSGWKFVGRQGDDRVWRATIFRPDEG